MTEEEYEAALKRADQLMSAEAGTPEGYELNELADKIVSYEEVHFPIDQDRTCTCIEFYGEDPNCKLHHTGD